MKTFVVKCNFSKLNTVGLLIVYNKNMIWIFKFSGYSNLKTNIKVQCTETLYITFQQKFDFCNQPIHLYQGKTMFSPFYDLSICCSI